jgi:hypothetical protein
MFLTGVTRQNPTNPKNTKFGIPVSKKNRFGNWFRLFGIFSGNLVFIQLIWYFLSKFGIISENLVLG